MERSVQSTSTSLPAAEELWIPNKHAYTHVGHDFGADSGLRVFKSSPESVAVQVRTNGPTNNKFGTQAGKTRPAYSTVNLLPEEIDELIKTLVLLRKRVRK